MLLWLSPIRGSCSPGYRIWPIPAPILSRHSCGQHNASKLCASYNKAVQDRPIQSRSKYNRQSHRRWVMPCCCPSCLHGTQARQMVRFSSSREVIPWPGQSLWGNSEKSCLKLVLTVANILGIALGLVQRPRQRLEVSKTPLSKHGQVGKCGLPVVRKDTSVSALVSVKSFSVPKLIDFGSELVA